VRTDLAARMIGLDADQLRAIPEVVVIAYGTAKRPAALAALRSGLVGGMVTHRALAEALLDEA
jgi:DNA-binding transcriptional regulator LsrR (DeoR family)